MNAFVKTLLAAILVGFAAGFIVAFSLLHSDPHNFVLPKIVPFVFAAVAFATFVTSWMIISGNAYGVARLKKLPDDTTRQLKVASYTSGTLFFISTIFVGSQRFTQRSFDNRLARIGRGELSTPDLKKTVDECIAHSGGAVLRQDFQLVDQIARSTHTRPEVLSYIVDQGDIASDFWNVIFVNPQATSEIKQRIEQLRLEEKQKGGGVVTDDTLRERAKHIKAKVTPY